MNYKQLPWTILNLNRLLKVPNQCPRNIDEQIRTCMDHLWLMYESAQIINDSYMILHKALMNHIWILSSPQEQILNLNQLFKAPNQCTRGVCRSHMGMNRSSMIHLWISTDHTWIIYELLQNIWESIMNSKQLPRTILNLNLSFKVPIQCTRDLCRSHMCMHRSSMIHLWNSTDHLWFIYEPVQNICESCMTSKQLPGTILNHRHSK
jgi:hypothetical protein